MRLLRRFLIRLSNFIRGRSADERLQEEIAEHLAFQTDENICRRRPQRPRLRDNVNSKSVSLEVMNRRLSRVALRLSARAAARCSF
jgi:hypothetical protein